MGRVLLVAPPCPESGVAQIEPFFPAPVSRAAVAAAAGETRIVCADADPCCPVAGGAAALYAEPLDVPAEIVPGGGHLNADAGLGPWPELEAWCLGARAQAAPTPR